jgi:DNA helicase-2/ATP-dependent DNA helicase PcrA
LIRLRYADGAIRIGDLDQLVAAAQGAQDVRHFVSELVLDPPSSSAALAVPPHLDEDFLVLSTVHSAKGLEWERRLFYVALTRARRRLHVYVPSRYHHRPQGRDDAHGYGQASRFLTEMVQSLFTISRSADPSGPVSGEAAANRRVEVSVDALFA